MGLPHSWIGPNITNWLILQKLVLHWSALNERVTVGWSSCRCAETRPLFQCGITVTLRRRLLVKMLSGIRLSSFILSCQHRPFISDCIYLQTCIYLSREDAAAKIFMVPTLVIFGKGCVTGGGGGASGCRMRLSTQVTHAPTLALPPVVSFPVA